MLDQEEDLDQEEVGSQSTTLSRKKMLIFLLPVLIVIGLSVGFYYAFNSGYNSTPAAYSIVQKGGSGEDEGITVLYDLPEFSATLHNDGVDKQALRLRLNLELSNVEDIKTIELLAPKINDVVLTHIIELSPKEVEGSTGLYWLKEELLYRLNLAVAPIKIQRLNIKSLEIQTVND